MQSPISLSAISHHWKQVGFAKDDGKKKSSSEGPKEAAFSFGRQRGAHFQDYEQQHQQFSFVNPPKKYFNYHQGQHVMMMVSEQQFQCVPMMHGGMPMMMYPYQFNPGYPQQWGSGSDGETSNGSFSDFGSFDDTAHSSSSEDGISSSCTSPTSLSGGEDECEDRAVPSLRRRQVSDEQEPEVEVEVEEEKEQQAFFEQGAKARVENQETLLLKKFLSLA